MRWSLYFVLSGPPLCTVAPGSLAEQKASRTQLIFSHLRLTHTDTFSESKQTVRTFKLSIFLRGQLISWRRCTENQAVCLRPQDNIQTDVPFFCVSIQCLILSVAEKKWRWQWWNGQIVWGNAFMIVGIAPWQHIHRFTNISMHCGQLHHLHCTLGIDYNCRCDWVTCTC